MATRNLPGSDAARHGSGDADLTIMLGAHAAFRRDLVRLARVTETANRADPARQAAIRAGWETCKRQLHLHHTAEDSVVWPALRQRLAHSEHAHRARRHGRRAPADRPAARGGGTSVRRASRGRARAHRPRP